jgi:hypothetical protein
MSWYRSRNKEALPNAEDFDAAADYSAKELEAFATAMLKDDIKESGNVENILFDDHLYNRRKREVYTTDGVPILEAPDMGTEFKTKNPGQTPIYNRTHPQGRKVNSEEQRRRNGASYYR